MNQSQAENFPPFYKRIRALIAHRYAIWFLGGATFAESIVSPLPPDFILAPMVVAKPSAAWRLAFWTTFASVLGAVGGYLIGAFFMDVFGDGLVDLYNMRAHLDRFTSWLREWGAVVILICAISPIPYKAVAITSGIALIDPLTFILMGLIGRGARFFAVAAICKKWGGIAEAFLLRQLLQSNGRDQVSFIFMAVLAILGAVFFLEYVKGFAPCTLCEWQRIPYYIVLGITFISLFLFSQKVYYWVLVVSAGLFFISAVLGGYHFGIELGFWQGFTACGGGGGSAIATTPQELLLQLEAAQPVSCAKAQWHLFGVSLAGYNMLMSLGFVGFIVWKFYEQK
jgi:membrane protein YqaA with SNARE-associated domain/disulfide bond formation protein DsbB